VFSIDGQQVFTQTHFMPNRRSWETIDKSETQPDWTMQAPNLMLITDEEDIPTLGNLISSTAISGLQNLDYEQSYAVLAFRGQQPSSGYGIEIEDISRQENRVVIHTQTTESIEEADTPSEPASPYHLIRVDRFYEEGDELDFALSVNDTEVLTRTVTIGQNLPIPTPTPVSTMKIRPTLLGIN